MILRNNKISARQLYRLMVTSSAGTTCLLSTDISIHYAGEDGLFCIIGASVLSLLYGMLIIRLCRKVKWNYTDYARKHFGNVINKIICFIFFIRYFIMLVLTAAVLLRMVRKELLTEMGYIGVLIPILLLMAYSVSRGLEARARMAECMIYTIIIPIIILAVLGISGTDRYYLVPLFNGNVSGIIKGGVVLFLLFSPLEMILFMSGNIAHEPNEALKEESNVHGRNKALKEESNVHEPNEVLKEEPNVHGRNKVPKHKTNAYRGTEGASESMAGNRNKIKADGVVEKAIIWGIITIFFINLVFYLISVGNLSSNVILVKGDAVLNLAKSVTLPYLVFEKQGGLFMLFFVVSLLIAIFCLAHHTMSMAETLMGRKNKVSYAALVLIVFIGLYVAVHHVDYFSEAAEVRETRVEIENREYADSMIINYEREQYTVVFSFPAGEGENRLEEYEVSNLNAIKYEYGQTSDKRLDLSHVQVVILGESILKNGEIFKEVIVFLENEQEISDSLNVCVIKQDMEKFTQNVKEGGIRPGKYISKMLENNIRYAKTQFKKISLVMYGAEQSCLLSVFSAVDGRLSYEGNMVVNKSGYVAEYAGNAAKVMELVSGDEGMEVKLGDETEIRVDKNDYYMNVDIIGKDTIHVKLIYSGKISGNPADEYGIDVEMAETEDALSVDEVNEIMEKMIFDRINSLVTEYDCDILGIYKHLAIADKEEWRKYKDNREMMLEHVFVEIEARYEWS